MVKIDFKGNINGEIKDYQVVENGGEVFFGNIAINENGKFALINMGYGNYERVKFSQPVVISVPISTYEYDVIGFSEDDNDSHFSKSITRYTYTEKEIVSICQMDMYPRDLSGIYFLVFADDSVGAIGASVNGIKISDDAFFHLCSTKEDARELWSKFVKLGYKKVKK